LGGHRNPFRAIAERVTLSHNADESLQSGAANVPSLLAGANSSRCIPASVYAGGANGFTLRSDVQQFRRVPLPAPGSVLP